MLLIKQMRGPSSQIKKKKKPKLKKTVQPDPRLKSEHQEERGTYESMSPKRIKEFKMPSIIWSSKMTLWQPFYACISCSQSVSFISHITTAVSSFCLFYLLSQLRCYFSPLKALFRLDTDCFPLLTFPFSATWLKEAASPVLKKLSIYVVTSIILILLHICGRT